MIENTEKVPKWLPYIEELLSGDFLETLTGGEVHRLKTYASSLVEIYANTRGTGLENFKPNDFLLQTKIEFRIKDGLPTMDPSCPVALSAIVRGFNPITAKTLRDSLEAAAKVWVVEGLRHFQSNELSFRFVVTDELFSDEELIESVSEARFTPVPGSPAITRIMDYLSALDQDAFNQATSGPNLWNVFKAARSSSKIPEEVYRLAIRSVLQTPFEMHCEAIIGAPANIFAEEVASHMLDTGSIGPIGTSEWLEDDWTTSFYTVLRKALGENLSNYKLTVPSWEILDPAIVANAKELTLFLEVESLAPLKKLKQQLMLCMAMVKRDFNVQISPTVQWTPNQVDRNLNTRRTLVKLWPDICDLAYGRGLITLEERDLYRDQAKRIPQLSEKHLNEVRILSN